MKPTIENLRMDDVLKMDGGRGESTELVFISMFGPKLIVWDTHGNSVGYVYDGLLRDVTSWIRNDDIDMMKAVVCHYPSCKDGKWCDPDEDIFTDEDCIICEGAGVVNAPVPNQELYDLDPFQLLELFNKLPDTDKKEEVVKSLYVSKTGTEQFTNIIIDYITSVYLKELGI